MSSFVRKVIPKLFRTSSEKAAGSTPEAGFVIAKKGDGAVSRQTKLINETPYVLYFREKVGSVYGGTRYTVTPHSHVSVIPVRHTYFKLVIYAGEELDEHGELDSEKGTGQSSQASKNVRTIDTLLSIDSDDLDDNVKISITFDAATNKFSFTKTPR